MTDSPSFWIRPVWEMYWLLSFTTSALFKMMHTYSEPLAGPTHKADCCFCSLSSLSNRSLSESYPFSVSCSSAALPTVCLLHHRTCYSDSFCCLHQREKVYVRVSQPQIHSPFLSAPSPLVPYAPWLLLRLFLSACVCDCLALGLKCFLQEGGHCHRAMSGSHK